MIGHLDTVFEDGLAEKHPFTLTEDNIATGLGCIDCKGGCLSVYHLIKLLIENRKDNFNFCVIFNSDEEAGSSNSEYYFHQFAEKADTVLFLSQPEEMMNLSHSEKAPKTILSDVEAWLLMPELNLKKEPVRS